MRFSGRVRAGEVTPLERGAHSRQSKRGETTADGGGGKGFAFPCVLAALGIQSSVVLS